MLLRKARDRAKEETGVLGRTAPGGEPGGERRARRAGAPAGVLVLILTSWIALGGCAIPFGNGAEPQQTRQERNRQLQDEYEKIERDRLMDRGGPSDR